MTCEELSDSIKGAILGFTVVTVVVSAAFTVIYYIDWLTTDPVKCVNGQAYEITIQGNVKYLDEVVGTKCEQLQ